MARAPRDTVKVRRLPKVGDEITIKVKVTRVADDLVTVYIPANGQLTTAKVQHLLPDDSESLEPAERAARFDDGRTDKIVLNPMA